MAEPNYEQCTYEELLDVRRHIDKDKYPERYEEIVRCLKAHKQAERDEPDCAECPKCSSKLEEKLIFSILFRVIMHAGFSRVGVLSLFLLAVLVFFVAYPIYLLFGDLDSPIWPLGLLIFGLPLGNALYRTIVFVCSECGSIYFGEDIET